MNNSIGSINLFIQEPQNLIMPVTDKELVWIQVPIAVDSGCCRHVTPNGLFCVVPTPNEGSKNNHSTVQEVTQSRVWVVSRQTVCLILQTRSS